MPETFDVIIVGGRCAGAPLATLLERAGLTTCIVDRAPFPSETPSTHAIQPAGVLVLQELGLYDAVAARAARIDGGHLAFNEDRQEIDEVTRHVGAPMLNIRRETLDAILLDAAGAAGAEIRTRTTVTGLVKTAGRVTGVETTAGELRASLVVGADGARSTIARLAGAREYAATPPGRVFMWGYFEGADAAPDRMWLGIIGEDAFLASPTDAGLFMAAAVPSIDRRDVIRTHREDEYVRTLARWPELQEALAPARRVGPVRMMSRWHGFFRESAGPGWVLVGDAGHFKDPTPGQGISDAFRQVRRLAPAIVQALDGNGGVDRDRPLADWWSWRDDDAWEMYWFAHDLGAPGAVPPLLREIQRRIAASEQLTLGMLRVLSAHEPPQEVFTPRLALGALPGAFRACPGERAELLREVRSLVGNEIRRRGHRARVEALHAR